MNRKIKILGIFLLLVLNTNAQTINELMQLSIENSSKLKAVQLQFEAAQQIQNQVGYLPDPQVGLGLPVLRTETRLGAPIVSVSVSQMFPWKGTLPTKKNVAIALSKTKYDDIEATKLDLEYQIRTAYYQLYILGARQDLLRENLRVNHSLEQVALGRVESGKAIASDVLRIQIKTKALEQQVKILEARKRRFEAQILEIVGLGKLPGDSIRIFKSELTQIPNLNQDLLDTNMKKIKANYPLLKKIDAKLLASQEVQKLNDLSGKPSFGVGLNYSLVQKRSDSNPLHNGRDILIPTFRATVPILRKKYSAKNQEEILKQKALDYQRKALEQKIQAMMTAYFSDYEQAILTRELADQQIKLSQSAFEMLLSFYSAKGSRFDELLKLQDDLFKYRLQKEIGLVNMFLAKAGMERFGH